MRSGYTIIFTLGAALLSGFCLCTLNNVSGVETTNGNIIATFHHEDGSSAANTAVYCIPEDYNPVKDSGQHTVFIDTTNNSGVCAFLVPKYKTYNLQAVQHVQRTRAFNAEIFSGAQTVYVHDTLQDPGGIKIILPDTVDSNNGYVFIGGTMNYCTFKSNIQTDPQGNKYVSLDSVPVASSLHLYYGEHSDTNSQLLTDTISVKSRQVAVFVVKIPVIKPTWHFRVIAGVTAQTLQYYGNKMDSVIGLIDQQMKNVNSNFNTSGVFSGNFNFYVDTVYPFSTSPVTNEFKKPPAGYAFRLIYNAYGDSAEGGFYPDSLTAYHVKDVSSGGKLFGAEASDEITRCFGLTRG